MLELTRRQREILDYVTACIRDQGYPPTIREIAAHLGLKSSNGVASHLRALERKGYLSRSAGKSRAIRPLAVSGRTVTVPFLDGQDDDLLEPGAAEQRVKLDRLLVGPSNDLFVLRTHAEMALCEGLSVGDYLVVSRLVHPGPDDLVVRLRSGQVVVERRGTDMTKAQDIRHVGFVQAIFRRL